MRKTYIFVYSNLTGTREELKNIINESEIIERWRYDLPNCFYLVSTYSAKEISSYIRGKCGKGSFLVSEIPSNSEGYLSSESWHLIQYQEFEKKA